jgi:hypothetical protein
MHVVWMTPLNRKGKMQGKLGDDSVIQTRASLDAEKCHVHTLNCYMYSHIIP